MDQNTQVASRSWVSKVIVLVLVIAAGGLAFLFGKKAEDSDVDELPPVSGSIVGTTTPAASPSPTPTPAATPATTPTPTTTPAPTTVVATTYKDGIYSAIGNYNAPSGAESIDVTLTVANDVITDATVDATSTNPASKQWQLFFIDNYKPLVVGMKLSDLKLSNVSGSSLTPKGFNDALVDIRAEAKA